MGSALDFPLNGAANSDIRLVWTGANFLSRTTHTVIWKAKYSSSQAGYCAVTWHSPNTGSWDFGVYSFGAHPYPTTGTYNAVSGANTGGGQAGSTHYHEIAGLGGQDFLATGDPGGVPQGNLLVTKDVWLTQARTVEIVGGTTLRHTTYPDIDNNPSFSIVQDYPLASIGSPGSPAFYFGASDWAASGSTNSETPGGPLRFFKLFSDRLSYTDIQTEAAAETNTPQTSAGIASIWYANIDPTPTDVTDKSGAGHDPSWANANRPTLLAVGPTIDTQPTDQIANNAATATFTVAATTSGGTLHYQWKNGGSNVGTDSSSYTTGTLSYSDQGAQITVEVSDDNGLSVSDAATLRVAYNLSGTGPRSFPSLGQPFAAGPFESAYAASASSAGSHATTGALSSQASTVTGTAVHSAAHPSTGALSAQAATLSGTAAHLLLHTSTGALGAQSANITAAAAHQLLHTSAGTLTAQDVVISGSAQHQHASSGALAAQSSTLAGSAARRVLHAASGAMTAQAAALSGAALHPHPTTGALVVQDAAMSGSADRSTPSVSHDTTGALSAQSATIAAAALHPHTTAGALSAQDTAVSGSAAHGTLHITAGNLAAQSATLIGAALHPHVVVGALAAQDANISAAAARVGTRASSGALVASASSIAGSASHTSLIPTHDGIGALQPTGATITGAADHTALHATSGALAAGGAAIAGTAAHEHAASGGLTAPSASISGAATHRLLHLSSGDLVAALVVMSGSAETSTPGLHVAAGSLDAQIATIVGSAEHAGGDLPLATDPKLIAKKRKPNQNITFKGAGGQAPRKKREQAPEPVKAKASPLLLGLMARGLVRPEPVAPVLPEPALDLASIAQAVLEQALPAAIEEPKQEVPATSEQQLAARVEQLEQQLMQMQADLAVLRQPPEPAQATARDPVHEALHALLPAISEPIDLDAIPEEPDQAPEALEAVAPPPAPPKMTREQIDAENERRARLAAERLL